MILVEPRRLEIGMLHLSIYDFTEVGQGNPLHAHGFGDKHISIVCSGLIRMWGRGWDEICAPGTIKQFLPDKEHAFEAVEVPARLIGIRY